MADFLDKAERRALDAKTEFDQTSRLVKSEVARFEQERIADFKSSLQAYLDGMIAKQKDVRSSLRTLFDILDANTAYA